MKFDFRSHFEPTEFEYTILEAIKNQRMVRTGVIAALIYGPRRKTSTDLAVKKQEAATKRAIGRRMAKSLKVMVEKKWIEWERFGYTITDKGYTSLCKHNERRKKNA